MLAPDDIAGILTTLKGFYGNILAADKLAAVGKSFTVYPVSSEAPWVASLRNNAKNLCRNGKEWETSKIVIVPQALTSFTNYSYLFTSVAAFLENVESGEIAANMLGRLITEIDKNIKSAGQAKTAFDDWIDQTLLNIDPLNESIQDGWHDLGASEAKVLDLAKRIVQTVNNINNLDGVITLDSISSGTVSSLTSVMSSTASLIYTVAIAGYAVPYLSVAILFFTMGKMFYDIFSTASSIHNEIRSLTDSTIALTQEQQALAQTKSALMLIYDIRNLIGKQRSSLLAVEEFWKNEGRNVRTVREQFLLDKNYSRENPEILQLRVADSVWTSLNGTAQNILSDINRPTDNRTQIKIGL